MPQRSSTSPITIVGLAHRQMLATSMTLPVESLRAAAQASPGRLRRTVNLHVMAKQPGVIEVANGLAIASQGFDHGILPDVLLIPAIWRNPHRVIKQERWQLELIEAAAANGSTVCSVGTGSYLLAETGLLDHLPATTHWHWFEDFAATYPRVKLRRDRLITQSDNLFCVGSVNSIADLMVYVAGLLFSRKSALAIENQFSPEIRRRFSPHELGPWSESHNDEKVLDAQLYLQKQLRAPLDVAAVAKAVHLTPRTLSRRFKHAVGLSMGSYLNDLKIQEAKSLLHHSNLTITDIAGAVGIPDASHFAQQFRRHTGVTPRQFRAAVRGKPFRLES